MACNHCEEEHMHGNEGEKKTIVRIVLGLFFLVFAVISEKHIDWKSLYYICVGTSYLILGYDVLFNAFKNTLAGDLFDENFLMTVATIGSACLGDFNEAVMVMLFYNVGEFVQDYAVEKSRDNIEHLVDIEPEHARLILPDGSIKSINPQDVKIGDKIQVLVGEKIPVDGIIIDGNGYIDTKSINGEPVPLRAKKGENALSGCIALESVLTISAAKEYKDSTVAKILELIEHSQNKKANTEKFITRFSKIYTPSVCAIALAVAIIPSLITGLWGEWIHKALIFLVISCPCALVLSVPLAFFAGIGGLAREGILVKGGITLENLSKTEAFVFDKTGTVTKGEFTVQKVFMENNNLLEVVSALESNSNHPIAKSIIEYCNNKVKVSHFAENITEESGLGLKAIVNNRKCMAGNIKLMEKYNIGNIPDIREAGTLIYVSQDNECIGAFLISDTIKEYAKDSIEKLKHMGIRTTVMLSGDKHENAESVGKSVGIDSCFGDLLPQDKVNKMMELKNDYLCTYVGDGVNDAPVMMESNVSIAMGEGGSDSAVEVSGIVLMNDDIRNIPVALGYAKRTMGIAKQNIVIALSIKLICMILSAFGITGMGLAVFSDTGVTLIAVANSLRAMRTRIK